MKNVTHLSLWTCLVLVLLTSCRGGGGGDGDGDGDVDADADGDADGGGDADADDGGWPEACPGIELTTDGVLDLDLHAVHITGSVTLQGGALPDLTSWRGSVSFAGEQTGASFSIDLEMNGPVSYSVVVPPDSYTVTFSGNSSLCDPAVGQGMPCTSYVLREDASLTSDGVLDLDLSSAGGSLVNVTGAVTVNDSSMPTANGDRGSLVFTSDQASYVTPPFGSSGSVSYSIDVLPGSYDISFAANASLCDGRTAPGMPCTGGVLMEGVSLTADGVLDVDIPAVDVSGAVLLEGSQLPSATGDRGSLSFTNESSGVTLPSFGTSGSVSYALTLLPGAYDIGFDGNESLCTGQSAAAVPCVDGTITSAAALTADGVRDVDLQMVTLTGAVTVNSQTVPDESQDRGIVSFSLEDGGSVFLSLGSSGAVTYALSLLPGTYAVAFIANSGLCSDSPAPRLPCTGGTLSESLPVTTDGVFDADIRSVRVSGAVTLNGQPFPDHQGERGHLALSSEDGGMVETPPSGSSGALDYELALWPGTYEVMWISNPALCDGDQRPLAPCMDGTVREAASLTTDGVLDVDVRSVQVEGAIKLNGETLPDAAGDRGLLVFTRSAGGTATTSSLGITGAASYYLSLLPGTYGVAYVANPGLCDGLVPPPVPCVGAALLEDVSLESSGVLDVDILSAEVTGALTVNGAVMADESYDRGALSFTSHDGSSVLLPSIGPVGPAAYGLTVTRGGYVIRHVANSSLCDQVRPSGQGVVPCADQWVAGCDRP